MYVYVSVSAQTSHVCTHTEIYFIAWLICMQLHLITTHGHCLIQCQLVCFCRMLFCQPCKFTLGEQCQCRAITWWWDLIQLSLSLYTCLCRPCGGILTHCGTCVHLSHSKLCHSCHLASLGIGFVCLREPYLTFITQLA